MDGANWLSLRNQYQNSYYISWSLNWSQIVRWCTWSRYEENNETHNQLHPSTALLLTQKIGGLSELPICFHTDARIIIMTKGRAGRIDHGQLSYPSHIDFVRREHNTHLGWWELDTYNVGVVVVGPANQGRSISPVCHWVCSNHQIQIQKFGLASSMIKPNAVVELDNKNNHASLDCFLTYPGLEIPSSFHHQWHRRIRNLPRPVASYEAFLVIVLHQNPWPKSPLPATSASALLVFRVGVSGGIVSSSLVLITAIN